MVTDTQNLTSLLSIIALAVAAWAAWIKLRPEKELLEAEAGKKEAELADVITNRAMLFLQQAEQRFSAEIAELETRLKSEITKREALEVEVRTLTIHNSELEERISNMGQLLITERGEREKLQSGVNILLAQLTQDGIQPKWEPNDFQEDL